jgi:hypothetical protein
MTISLAFGFKLWHHAFIATGTDPALRGRNEMANDKVLDKLGGRIRFSHAAVAHAESRTQSGSADHGTWGDTALMLFPPMPKGGDLSEQDGWIILVVFMISWPLSFVVIWVLIAIGTRLGWTSCDATWFCFQWMQP